MTTTFNVNAVPAGIEAELKALLSDLCDRARQSSPDIALNGIASAFYSCARSSDMEGPSLRIVENLRQMLQAAANVPPAQPLQGQADPRTEEVVEMCKRLNSIATVGTDLDIGFDALLATFGQMAEANPAHLFKATCQANKLARTLARMAGVELGAPGHVH